MTQPAAIDSPAANAARELRKKLGHVVAELQTGANALRTPCAALFTAHMVADLGQAAVAKMKPAEVQAYAARFRARYPSAWGKVVTGHVLNFVRSLEAYKLEHDDVATYQTTARTLAG